MGAKKFIIPIFIVLTMMIGLQPATATTIYSKMTVDNGFYAYISEKYDEAGTLIFTQDKITGTEWADTQKFYWTLLPGHDYYLHIIALNTTSWAGFVGEFNLYKSLEESGTYATDFKFANELPTLFTNSVDWQIFTEYFGYTKATTTTPFSIAPNDSTSVWYAIKNGVIEDVSQSAMWIWDAEYGREQVTRYFSTPIYYTGPPQPTPEPTALFLLGTGLGGITAFRRKIKT